MVFASVLLFSAGCGSADSPLGADGLRAVPVAAPVEASIRNLAPVFEAPELLGFPMPSTRRPAAPPQSLRAPSASGCGAALPAGVSAGKTALRTIASGGMKRTYRLHLPARGSNAQKMPLVLNFHGRTATGIDQELVSGLVPLSDRETFVLVSPDGTGSPMGWSAGATEPNGIDDVRFTEDLLNAVTREFCIDSARVYATGFSNGAFMSSRLACAMPDRIAAVAVVGGIDYPGEACKSTVPVLAVHGTADKIVPIEGGIVRAWRYRGAYSAIGEWAANNGCRPVTEPATWAEGVSHEVYVDCAAPTEFVTIEGSGHLWPGAPGIQPGDPASRISGAEVVWKFLSQKRAPVV